MSKRVLVADDDLALVALVRDVLESEGLEVIAVHDGVACMDAIVSQRPDLVVLDVVMPAMDGFQVLQALRQRRDAADLPVIMLTTLASDLDVLRGWMKGVDCYLTKPFDPAELAALTRRLLQGDVGGPSS